MKTRSVLPLMLVLIAAPFFADPRANPLRFGLLQGVLIAMISVGAAGGFAEFRKKLSNPWFALFWIAVLMAGIAVPFFMPL